ncbi:hypothetical protein CONPUDRAFT_118739, partial [Coniophora puteana RWD-64-598 SS2]
MVMALPKDLPTLCSLSTGNYTRPDNVFCTEHTAQCVVSCEVLTDRKLLRTDHFLIATCIDFRLARDTEEPRKNFRDVGWENFNDVLGPRIRERMGAPGPILTHDSLHSSATTLTSVLQETIEELVPNLKLSPHSRRWWTRELSELRDECNQ